MQIYTWPSKSGRYGVASVLVQESLGFPSSYFTRYIEDGGTKEIALSRSRPRLHICPCKRNPSSLHHSPSLIAGVFRSSFSPHAEGLGGPSAGVSMVDSSINSLNVDPEVYPTLHEMIQTLGRKYRSFDKRSCNLRRSFGLTAIPDIHISLQMDDSARRGVSSGQGDSDQGRVDFAERTTAGTHASTSTSSSGPPSTSGAGGENVPLRNVYIIPPLPTELEPMPYNNFYGDGPRGFTKEFRTKYSIPNDVLVERVSGDKISFGDDFIILPLFAITEGGVRFPMSPFLCYFLSDYNLGPIQVAVNTWRILCSVIKLAESNNLPFTLGDLMLMYIVSRNPKYDKYYLTTHQHFDHLVDRLYDTEKWGNALVKVSGNFEWGPINPLLDYPCLTRTGSAMERPYRIPRMRGFPSTGDKPST
ncbi:hypothetical protein RHSIM_Rhsim03G0059200 [Rhododendron simsii]|uniref:Uncharacterized protein n=1 Tax=Rhododendron simsii TaxID=118357 RepID=A0A834H494_RHOSS|nr:hypothetical protein RHSIM_Rhsim03G0059200 [Rhododendron simsii]